MEEETRKLVNQKVRDLLNNDNEILAFNKAVELLKALNNPLKSE